MADDAKVTPESTYNRTTETPSKSKIHGELVKATLDAAEAAKVAIKQAHDKATELQAATNSEEARAIVSSIGLAAQKIKEAAETAKEAGDTKVLLSISVKTEFPKSVTRQRKVDWGQQGYAAVAFLVAFLFVLNDWLVDHGHVKFPNGMRWWYALIPIGLIDVFLILLLRAVVARGNRTREQCPFIPNKGPAVRTLILFYFAFVLFFAHLNWALNFTASMPDALYEGFLTVLKLDPAHGVGSDLWNRGTVAFELLSVVLLFLVFFPLLIARLALFEGETISLADLQTACKKDAVLAKRLDLTVTADSGVDWKPSNILGSVLSGEKIAVLEVDEQGTVKISKGAARASAD